MIRQSNDEDFESICSIINESARAYKGIIPDDRWKDPYMSKEELSHEIREGVVFWVYLDKVSSEMAGVMGIQNVRDVTLIRHSYVLTSERGKGIGSELLNYLRMFAVLPILIGTWADADWAIRFYEKNGFRIVSPDEKKRLLKEYWTIPDRQVETSVVLREI